MKLSLCTTAAPSRWNRWALSDLQRLRRAAAESKQDRHCLCDCPEEADLIIFCGTSHIYHSDLLRSDLFWRNRDRSVIVDSRDLTIPLVPGVYASLTARQKSRCDHFEALPYFRVFDNMALSNVAPLECSAVTLYSFVGAVKNSRSLRARILSLKDDRALLRDSSSGQADGNSAYAQLMQNSKFILCPKGLGASSWRIYEAMRAGRIPVIISDQWVPPPLIDWSSFSLRVREGDVARLPEILRKYEPLAPEMGQSARAEWESKLSLHESFGWLGDVLESIAQRQFIQGKSILTSRYFEALSSGQHRLPFIKEKARDAWLAFMCALA